MNGFEPEQRLSKLVSDPLVRRIWHQLGGAQAFLTGGYVRDTAIGRPSHDLDIAIEGDAATVRPFAERLAEALRTRSHLIGQPPRAVFRIETPDLKVELWPLNGRSPRADAMRRDLTCNAIQWRLPDGPIFDPTAGIDDLKKGSLRAISRSNLERDPVRLVRLCRFAAELPTFTVEAESRQWMTGLASRIADAPRERTGHELLILLRSAAPDRGLALLQESSLLVHSCPAKDVDLTWMRRHLTTCTRIRHPAMHPVPAAARAAGETAALAYLFRVWRITDPAEVAGFAWNAEMRKHALKAARLTDLASTARQGPPPTRRSVIHRAGLAFPALMALAAAGSADRGEERHCWRTWWRMWQRSGAQLVSPRPLLAAGEIALIAGLQPGPALGELVSALVDAQVEGRVRSPGGARRWLARRLKGTNDERRRSVERLC